MALAAVQNGETLEQWATASVVIYRLVAAEHLAARDSDGHLSPLLKELAFDSDREVARAAVQNLSSVIEVADVAEELGSVLRQVSLTKPGDWDCTHCGTSNHVTATGCSECYIVPPDPVGAAHEALADLLGSAPESGTV